MVSSNSSIDWTKLMTAEENAEFVKTPLFDELNSRLQQRAKTGKIIPSDVMLRMINDFEHPTLEEGFDQIWHAE